MSLQNINKLISSFFVFMNPEISWQEIKVNVKCKCSRRRGTLLMEMFMSHVAFWICRGRSMQTLPLFKTHHQRLVAEHQRSVICFWNTPIRKHWQCLSNNGKDNYLEFILFSYYSWWENLFWFTYFLYFFGKMLDNERKWFTYRSLEWDQTGAVLLSGAKTWRDSEDVMYHIWLWHDKP